MKHYSKIVLLVALALFLGLTACTRTASTSPVPTATTAGEVPFPVKSPTAGNVAAFATQTALAKAPQGSVPSATPAVLVATPTAGGSGEAGSGAEATATTAPNSGKPVVVPTVARPASYTLQNGEWPICVARRFNLDISTFFSANGLSMASKPSAGTVLKIPASVGAWNATYGTIALVKHPATYTVVAGDTVYTIACKYGNVAPEQILAANSLAKATDVKAGMKLQIP